MQYTYNRDEALEELERLFVEVDAKTATFSSDASLTCPDGCTICCTKFVPEVTEVEARLITERGDPPPISTAPRPGLSGACPFFDPERRCTIYPFRPLICRLFAFSGTRDKHGEIGFSICREMPGTSRSGVRRSFRGREIPLLFGSEPPDMQRMAMRLSNIAGGDAASQLPIDIAVARVTAVSLLRRQFAEANRDQDDFDPDKPLRPAA